MLESKFALNNLNFKCYFQFFLSEHELDQKNGGGVNLTPPPGNPRIGQHPGKGGVKLWQAGSLTLVQSLEICNYALFPSKLSLF